MASLTCFGFTLLYVGGLYVCNTVGSRDDPVVIRARMKAVTAASAASIVIVWSLFQYHNYNDSPWKALGLVLPQHHLLALLYPLLLTATLFLGPLAVLFFNHELPFQRYFNLRDFFSLVGQRNYVVGPLTEEFVFRACMIAVLFQAGYSRNYLIYVSPLYFGIAHLHHAWGNYTKMGKTTRALKQALFSSLFQFAYTTLFGWYASFLFLRTASLWPPVICHTFCNMMGFPDTSDVQSKSRLQKSVIYTCFPIGILLFIYKFQKFTDPTLVGGSMYWK